MGYVASPPTIVYEFMDEGSLHDHLHGQVGTFNHDKSACIYVGCTCQNYFDNIIENNISELEREE